MTDTGIPVTAVVTAANVHDSQVAIPNRRRSGQLCPMEKAQSDLYRMRSAVERAYAHLKDWLIPTKLYVPDIEKVTFQILRGVLCLAALKLLQCCIVPYFKKQEA
jgi:hypothetical protein